MSRNSRIRNRDAFQVFAYAQVPYDKAFTSSWKVSCGVHLPINNFHSAVALNALNIGEPLDVDVQPVKVHVLTSGWCQQEVNYYPHGPTRKGPWLCFLKDHERPMLPTQ